MVSGGIIHIRVVGRGGDAESVRRKVEAVGDGVRRRLGGHIIGDEGETLQEAVAKLLEQTGRRMAVAESCTGGIVAGMLTDVPGISRFFLEGVVAYSNEAKVRLGVPAEVIKAHGAVSAEVAEAMAEAIRKRSGADIGLGITGIAGPTGGTPTKPVGLVHFAVLDEKGILSREERFIGGRMEVRDRAAKMALNLARLRLRGEL
jgi:nicotinamide-nucleotide amidase